MRFCIKTLSGRTKCWERKIFPIFSYLHLQHIKNQDWRTNIQAILSLTERVPVLVRRMGLVLLMVERWYKIRKRKAWCLNYSPACRGDRKAKRVRVKDMTSKLYPRKEGAWDQGVVTESRGPCPHSSMSLRALQRGFPSGVSIPAWRIGTIQYQREALRLGSQAPLWYECGAESQQTCVQSAKVRWMGWIGQRKEGAGIQEDRLGLS
jgi:hypothetical protein